MTLDLCARYFKRIQPVFMRLGPILSFQRACLDWVERRYRVPVMIVPHPMLVEWLRYGTFREYDFDVPIDLLPRCIHLRPVEVRRLVDRGRGTHRGLHRTPGHDQGRRRRGESQTRAVFPLAHWSKSDVYAYIRHHRLKVAPETQHLSFSFRSLMEAISPRAVGSTRRITPTSNHGFRSWASVWRSMCLRRNRRVRHERRRDQISER